MLVFHEIMRVENVMFGAFELFDDLVLKDLLTPFIAVMEACNLGELFADRRIGQHAWKLGNHSRNVTECECLQRRRRSSIL
jgi:hypothetical protein